LEITNGGGEKKEATHQTCCCKLWNKAGLGGGLSSLADHTIIKDPKKKKGEIIRVVEEGHSLSLSSLSSWLLV